LLAPVYADFLWLRRIHDEMFHFVQHDMESMGKQRIVRKSLEYNVMLTVGKHLIEKQRIIGHYECLSIKASSIAMVM
jgi:hypothetical protein